MLCFLMAQFVFIQCQVTELTEKAKSEKTKKQTSPIISARSTGKKQLTKHSVMPTRQNNVTLDETFVTVNETDTEKAEETALNKQDTVTPVNLEAEAKDQEIKNHHHYHKHVKVSHTHMPHQDHNETQSGLDNDRIHHEIHLHSVDQVVSAAVNLNDSSVDINERNINGRNGSSVWSNNSRNSSPPEYSLNPLMTRYSSGNANVKLHSQSLMLVGLSFFFFIFFN
jgi:hypothetical protein